MDVAILADAGPSAGLGHLGRCSAVATALRTRGISVACVAHGADAPVVVDGIEWRPGTLPPARIVVLDSYTLPERDRAALAPAVVFHDHGPLPVGPRLILTIAEDGEHVLGGLRHAPLRPAYWGLPQRAVRDRIQRILVTTGGGALQAPGPAAALRDAYPDATVALVRGPYARFEPPAGVELIDAPTSLLDEFLAADVVVTAAGQSALEAVATGAATIAIPYVDNQRRQAEALAAAGAAVVVAPDDAVAAVAELDRAELAARGQAAVDGFGALRIAFRIARLL